MREKVVMILNNWQETLLRKLFQICLWWFCQMKDRLENSCHPTVKSPYLPNYHQLHCHFTSLCNSLQNCWDISEWQLTSFQLVFIAAYIACMQLCEYRVRQLIKVKHVLYCERSWGLCCTVGGILLAWFRSTCSFREKSHCHNTCVVPCHHLIT